MNKVYPSGYPTGLNHVLPARDRTMGYLSATSVGQRYGRLTKTILVASDAPFDQDEHVPFIYYWASYRGLCGHRWDPADDEVLAKLSTRDSRMLWNEFKREMERFDLRREWNRVNTSDRMRYATPTRSKESGDPEIPILRKTKSLVVRPPQVSIRGPPSMSRLGSPSLQWPKGEMDCIDQGMKCRSLVLPPTAKCRQELGTAHLGQSSQSAD